MGSLTLLVWVTGALLAAVLPIFRGMASAAGEPTSDMYGTRVSEHVGRLDIPETAQGALVELDAFLRSATHWVGLRCTGLGARPSQDWHLLLLPAEARRLARLIREKASADSVRRAARVPQWFAAALPIVAARLSGASRFIPVNFTGGWFHVVASASPPQVLLRWSIDRRSMDQPALVRLSQASAHALATLLEEAATHVESAGG